VNLKSDTISDVLEAVRDAIVLVDGSGGIVFVNRAANTLFGYAEGELQGRKVEALVPEGFRDSHERHRQRYDDKPRLRPMLSGLRLQGLRKDGTTFDAEIQLTPIAAETGTLVATTIRDISADAASETYFRNILESAPDAMIIVDNAGKIRIVNGQAQKMFGYQRDEMLGSDIELLIPEEVRQRHVGRRSAYTANPQLRPMGSQLELRGRRKDGSEFPVEISLSPVTSSAGTFISSVIRDVTRRKRMEQELIDARQAAERANKANNAFLAAASHDLRQPVQALSLLNGALRRTVKEPLALEMIDSQQHSLTAMTNLLNSLLDISRLDAGKVEPEIEDFSIQRLVDRLFSECSRQARHKGLNFEAQTCEQLIVRSDPNLLSEIIQNIVSNAIRYTDQGTVAVRCRPEGDRLWIDVSDTGIGIEASQLEEIFREFHQIKTPGKEKEGFGLGLAIVKRLAELLDHEIHVESDVGRGSTFSVCLPIIEQTSAEIIRFSEAGEDSTGNATSGLIILIEDDVSIANAWGLLLEAEGFRVAMAGSAKEAAAVVNHLAEPPDLIISDFHLIDGSTGVEAVAMVREAFDRNVPAFIVTGDTSKMVQEAKGTENCVIMNKPVNTDSLLKDAIIAIETGHVPEH